MLEFLRFRRNKSDTTDHADTLPATRPVPGEHPTSTQREMVRLTLHTLLKRHGIPTGWLGTEIRAFPTSQDPEGVLLQLVIHHWHPGFGLYALALQNEVIDGLKRFDPTASAARYHIHWKFAPDCGSSHGPLPATDYWTGTAPVLGSTDPNQLKPALKPKFDLPDNRDDDDPDNGFAATQIHDIR